jgi:hypothetical protein
MLELWLHLKWALLGLGIFFIAWFWALMTSLRILDSASKDERSNKPPLLGD